MVVINDVLSKTVKLCHNRWSRTREKMWSCFIYRKLV